jgi:hypothetical protein
VGCILYRDDKLDLPSDPAQQPARFFWKATPDVIHHQMAMFPGKLNRI